ncbi:DUF4292 domain-containing protein [Telluribacter sp. SYSU D00476]|uniref:DUF4292 domain-containing protein n=1 Tax=Telluribacter sp. SYSU D00476 TaxID=2811430 RepID=UPI001FF4A238|nr:DUF4292 domain-containing protein [Telluribacter sp. SYSU D00476]
MNSKIIWWFGIVGCLLFTACHKPRTQSTQSSEVLSKKDSAKVVTADTIRADTVAARQPEEEGSKININVEEINFSYLLARSKFSFKSRTQNIDNANVNLRVKKDSLIWLSVTGAGFEVARGIITPDSIVFIDKFHKEYFVFTYPQISRQFNFELSFPLIQSLIVGNLPLPREPDQKVRREKDYLLLRQKEGRIMIDNYIGENTRKLKRLQAVEQPSRNSLTLDYEDFQQLSNYLFPYTSLITLDVKSPQDQQYYQTVIRIKHNKVELTDSSPGFPFNIPSSYKRKQ